jgi:transposase-like protein
MVAPYARTPTPPQPNETGTTVYISLTNPMERLNGEIKRRNNVVGIFPTRAPSRV